MGDRLFFGNNLSAIGESTNTIKEGRSEGGPISLVRKYEREFVQLSVLEDSRKERWVVIPAGKNSVDWGNFRHWIL